MDSIRQKRVAQLIQEEVARLFSSGTFISTSNALLTISRVIVTADLGIARIYISMFNVTDKESVLHAIRQRTGELRHLLSQKIRNQVRVIPELEFYVDDTLDYVTNLEEIFKKIK